MAGTPDTFTVAEAAKVLGVTPKRVRQVIASGTLQVIEGSNPARLSSADVIALRDQRKARQGRGTSRPGPQAQTTQTVALEDVLTLAQTLTERALTAAAESHAQALEARDRIEDHLKQELAQARQETERLRAELAEAQGRRSWFRR